MAISQRTRFENHMDIASPEIMGDAKQVSDFYDDRYDDDFEKKLSEMNDNAELQQKNQELVNDNKETDTNSAQKKCNTVRLDTESENNEKADRGNYRQHYATQQMAEKIIAAAMMIDTVGDILGGAASITTHQTSNEYNREPQTVVVSNVDEFNVHTLEEVMGELGVETCEDVKPSVEDAIINVAQAIETIGSDAHNQAEYVAEQMKIDVEDAELCTQVLTEEKDQKFDEYIQKIGDKEDELTHKYTLVEKQPLYEDADTFLEGRYLSVVFNEDVKLYRIYGGGSSKEGNPENENIFLSAEKPADRMYEKMELALSNRWQDKMHQPNTREFYCEVIVPKGSIANIGYVAPQNTLGGQELMGGGIQVMTQKEGLIFGEERRLGYSCRFKDFEKLAKKIEPEH